MIHFAGRHGQLQICFDVAINFISVSVISVMKGVTTLVPLKECLLGLLDGA